MGGCVEREDVTRLMVHGDGEGLDFDVEVAVVVEVVVVAACIGVAAILIVLSLPGGGALYGTVGLILIAYLSRFQALALRPAAAAARTSRRESWTAMASAVIGSIAAAALRSATRAAACSTAAIACQIATEAW